MLEARLIMLITIVDSCIIPKNTIKPSFINYNALTASAITGVLLSPSISRGQPLLAKECDNPVYTKSVFNIPPAAFKFPSVFEGTKLNEY
jgi:hypothetical protein